MPPTPPPLSAPLTLPPPAGPANHSRFKKPRNSLQRLSFVCHQGRWHGSALRESLRFTKANEHGKLCLTQICWNTFAIPLWQSSKSGVANPLQVRDLRGALSLDYWFWDRLKAVRLELFPRPLLPIPPLRKSRTDLGILGFQSWSKVVRLDLFGPLGFRWIWIFRPCEMMQSWVSTCPHCSRRSILDQAHGALPPAEVEQDSCFFDCPLFALDSACYPQTPPCFAMHFGMISESYFVVRECLQGHSIRRSRLWWTFCRSSLQESEFHTVDLLLSFAGGFASSDLKLQCPKTNLWKKKVAVSH